MADKAVRASSKLVPRLSGSARKEVCRVSLSLLEDMDRNISRALRISDYVQIRNIANEAAFLSTITSTCRRKRR